MLTARTRGSAAISRQSRVGGGEAELRRGLLGPAGHLVGDGDQSRAAGPAAGSGAGTRAYAWVCTRPIQPNPTTATPSVSHHDCPSLDRSNDFPAHTEGARCSACPAL